MQLRKTCFFGTPMMHCDTIQSEKDGSALSKPKRPFIIFGEIGRREYHAAISVHFVEVAAAVAVAKLSLILEFSSVQFPTCMYFAFYNM